MKHHTLSFGLLAQSRQAFIALLLAFTVIWVHTAHAQVHIQSGQTKINPEQESELGKTFSDFTLAEVDLEGLERLIDSRSGATTMNLKVGGQDLTFELSVSNAVQMGSILTLSENGIIPFAGPQPITYTGIRDDHGNLTALLTISKGFLSGYVRIDDNLHLIEPLYKWLPDAPHSEIVIYTPEDVIHTEPRACGTPADPSAPVIKEIDLNRTTTTLPNLEMDMLAVADFEFFSIHGILTVAEVTSIFNVMNSLYYNNDIGLTFTLSILVFESGDPYIPIMVGSDTDASSLLEEFRTWLTTAEGLPSYGVANLFSGFEFAGSTVGLAYVGAACQNNNCAINQMTFSDAFNASTLAHETGHMLGANHDGVGNLCPISGYIMSSNGNPNDPFTVFSDCSKAYFQIFYDATGLPCATELPVYTWQAGDWGVCSQECGGGIQTRAVSCLDESGQIVSNSLCDPNTQPESQQACNEEPCPVDCVLSDWSSWSECSVSCGGGTRHRTRTVLVAPQNGGAPCGELIEYMECNTQSCYSWTVSAWGECSSTCGEGTQTRTVACINENGEVVANSLCDPNTQPAYEQACNGGPCYTWTVSAWGECSSTCGEGTQTRTVACINENGEIVANSLCDAESMPESVQPCLTSPDADGDGLIDCQDNCPYDPNSLQLDTDQDGKGDICDDCPLMDDAIANKNPESCGCIPGYYAVYDETGTLITGCQPCEPGTYCPDGINSYECEAGTFQNQYGMVTCYDCPAGTFSSTTGATECQSCPAGTYNNQVGAEYCSSCPAGTYSDITGAVGCSICDAGTSSDTGASECYPDADGDGIEDSVDPCPLDPENDVDGDGICGDLDGCPFDPSKAGPGQCGCGVPDTDADGDGVADCLDSCPLDASKTEPGICGCGISDADSDGDGVVDCEDGCPYDADKTEPGACGCSIADIEADGGPDLIAYYGYPNSVDLSVSVSDGTPGYTYSWTPDTDLTNSSAATPTFTPSTPGTVLFTVTVTDANGCTATATQTVVVEDVTCANNGNQEKVIMCHDGETVCVNINSVSAHLNHGDYLGPCTMGMTIASTETADLGQPAVGKTRADQIDAEMVNVYPNPFRDVLTISLNLGIGIDNMRVSIYDTHGKQVDQLWSGPASDGQHTLNWDGGDRSAGVYILVIQTERSRVAKQLVLIK